VKSLIKAEFSTGVSEVMKKIESRWDSEGIISEI
jgi:hypothetical protein